MASKDKKLLEKQDDSSLSEIKRRFKANPFIFSGTIVVLVIVIVAFVFLPMNPVGPSGGAGDMTFGYYNKIPISYAVDNYFYNIQQMLLRYYQSSINDSNYLSAMAEIWSMAFTEAAIHTGKLDEMKRAGYTAPEDKVDREVALLPQFQENGRFSIGRYRQMDNSSRMNLWRHTRETIAAGIYTADFESLGISSRELEFFGSMLSPQRSFDVVSFAISTFPDSEIIAFAAANPQLFRISSLSRITVNSSEREAKQILESIENGVTTFEDAARANSQDYDSERGGDMGSRMTYELEYIIPEESDRQEVANLRQGNISRVIQVGEKSWAFFRADENPRLADTDDPSIMDKIRNYVFFYERGIAEDWVLGEARKFVSEAKEMGFDNAVFNRYMQKQTFGPLPINYGDLYMFPMLASSGVPELQSQGNNEEFWRVAFSTPIGTPSNPVVAGDSVVVVLPLEEIEPYYDEYYYRGLESQARSDISQNTDMAIRAYFLNSDKFDNRFNEVFRRYWGN